MHENRPQGGISQKPKSDKPINSRKGGPRYLQLKQPKDVMAYVQTIINQLRKTDSDIGELGKVSQLLNTWVVAYKAQIDTNDIKKLQAEIDELKLQLKK